MNRVPARRPHWMRRGGATSRLQGWPRGRAPRQTSWQSTIGFSRLEGMRLGIGVLALLLAAAVPAMLFAGATILRGLGWLGVVAVGAVLLIDLGDRVTEWVE